MADREVHETAVQARAGRRVADRAHRLRPQRWSRRRAGTDHHLQRRRARARAPGRPVLPRQRAPGLPRPDHRRPRPAPAARQPQGPDAGGLPAAGPGPGAASLSVALRPTSPVGYRPRRQRRRGGRARPRRRGRAAPVRSVRPPERVPGLAGPEARRFVPAARHTDRGRGQVGADGARLRRVQAVLVRRAHLLMSRLMSRPMSRLVSRRSVSATIAAGLVAAAAFAVWFAVNSKPRVVGDPARVPTATAPVTRGTVTQRVRIPGTYGYDGNYPVVHQGTAGILTGAATIGATVDRGGVLYRIDNRAVRLLYGGTPAYRDLKLGVTDGPDVREREQNLVDLHMDPSGQITVDDHFTGATDAAIRRWQSATGDGRTGGAA